MIIAPSLPEPSSTTYIECGAASKRRLTIGFEPESVRLSRKTDSVELLKKTWEYGFTSDEPLELWFESTDTFTCMINGNVVTLRSDGPHWICNRPTSDTQEFELSFSLETPKPGTTAGFVSSSDKPVAAQPTLIIRTKRSCPTGVKPGADK